MNRSLVAATCLLAAETTALAEDGKPMSPDEAAAPAADAYPTAYVERPLTLPTAMVEAWASGSHWWVDEEEDESTIRAGAIVGLTDWWQVSAGARLLLAPERAWGNTIGVESRVLVVDTARFDFAPGLDAGLLFDGDRDTPAVSTVGVNPLFRIRILRRSALYVGDNLVRFGFGDERSGSVNLDGAYVTQFGDHVALRITARLAHLRAYGEGAESGGPYLPGMTVIVSPASWIDVWGAFQLGSDSRGLFAGVACRL